jgi:lipoprotein-releasing system ATP-binding protein
LFGIKVIILEREDNFFSLLLWKYFKSIYKILMSALIVGKNISKKYENLEVLNVPNIEIERGVITSIVGASGAGKSTLLHILGTLLHPTSGDIFIEEEHISKFNDTNLALFRNQKLGFVFQNHNLLPEFSAFENVCLPAIIGNRNPKEYETSAKEWLQRLGLSERMHHKPSELSGGEQQRVSVARALINNPKLIFADEPSGNLDSKNAFELHELFKMLKNDFGYTFLIVTHNKELAQMSDRLIEMRDGKIII